MQYLTNYYKNLSEQLQERINILEKYLAEVKVTKVVDGVTVKWDPSEESESDATERALKTDPRAPKTLYPLKDGESRVNARLDRSKERAAHAAEADRKEREFEMRNRKRAANNFTYNKETGEFENDFKKEYGTQYDTESESQPEPKPQPKPGEPGYQGPSAGRKQ
jgi:hypothetical protein